MVTGGASGIGYATAVRLADEGAVVLACDVSGEGLTALSKDGAARGLKIHTIRADVTAQNDVDQVFHAAQTLGTVAALANVAGIMDGFLPAHELDDETWTRVMAVNVEGPFRLTRAFLPGMRKHGTGAIANVGSVAGVRGGAAGLAYTTSKHALVGLTRSIAWTYAPDGIRCNLVNPGYVNTGIGASGSPRSGLGLERAKPILAQSVRRADPAEVAGVLSWLLSAEAGTINGSVVGTDSGWTAG